MYSETWQQLLRLETRDAVFDWHKKICGRDLNSQRIQEIVSAAKQGREFFRSAEDAHNSVKPLLTFYGVASLSKALLLLLKPGAGEGALVPAHGLVTLDWRTTIASGGSNLLSEMASLKVKTSKGLFTDFVRETKNKICIHVSSSAVDWRINHDQPAFGDVITFKEILSRTPDLAGYLPASVPKLSASVNTITYTDKDGFKAVLNDSGKEIVSARYVDDGYSFQVKGNSVEIYGSKNLLESKTPQFMHTYVHKTFGTIPQLYVTSPFEGNSRYSQLAVSYMLAYFLGMLARYFPTQWVSLSSGVKGDELWPAVNAAQKYVQTCFPELVLELIRDSENEKPAAGA